MRSKFGSGLVFTNTFKLLFTPNAYTPTGKCATEP